MILPKHIDEVLQELVERYRTDSTGKYRKGEAFTIAQDVSKEELLTICIMEHKLIHAGQEG